MVDYNELEPLSESDEELLESAIASRERTVDTSRWRDDPLSLHEHGGDNLLLCWNDAAIDAQTIDVIIHLHGYISRNPNTDTLRELARRSGLELAGRGRPALGILPLGRRITEEERLRHQERLNDQARTHAAKPQRARDDVYTFPALTAGEGKGLELLVNTVLRWFGSQILRRNGEPPAVGRIILTAHSGGGAAVNSLVANSARCRVCNPDELHVFDGLYGEATGLKRWLAGRLAADLRRSSDDMRAQGGGLRVFFRPKELSGTQYWSEELARSLPAGDHPLHPWYRAECTTVEHLEIPNKLGPPMLHDRAANLSFGMLCKNSGLARSLKSVSSKQYAESARSRPTPTSAPLPHDVQGWILSTDRSAIELITNPTLRNRFFREIDWTQEHFPRKDKTGRLIEGRLAEELFTAMVRVVPERRVPHIIKYRPDIADIVVSIPGEPKSKTPRCRPFKMLHPEASNAFVRMRDKAAKDGIPLKLLPGCRTAWRTPEEQADVHRSQPNPLAAAGGIGPHMYGLAVDLTLSMPRLLQVAEANTKTPERMANIVRMYRSPIYKWMAVYGSRFGWFPYGRAPWHWEYNPPGFKGRYEGWPVKNRGLEFESDFELEGELEDEVAELEPLSPRPAQYPGRDTGLTSLVAESELEAWAVRARPRPQTPRRPVAQPRTPVGKLLIPFTSRAIPKYRDRDGRLQSTLCAVCVPNAAWRQTAVDLLVFFHGDQIESPGPCKHDFDPDKVIRNFLLDVQLDRSGRKVALAVPVIHWKQGESGESKNFRGKWCAENLNKFVDEVLDEIGRQSGVKPTLGRLIIAGHSHAYAILTPLALEFHSGTPATREGALAKLNGVWALDSTYGGRSAGALDSWARALPSGRFIAVLNKQSSGKKPIDGWTAYLNTFSRGAGPPPNLKMCKVEETHCVIPTKYIGQLLSATSYPPSWCVP